MQSKIGLTGLCILGSVLLSACHSSYYVTHANSASEKVMVHAISAEGIGEEIGTITLSDSSKGLMVKTHLSKLPEGMHGFHIHEKGSCDPAMKDGKATAGLGAGFHYNPNKVEHHGTPLNGHLGDLPSLMVNASGHANVTVYAPRVRLSDVRGLAIMIHAGGDNYSDMPKPYGGGGERIACGLIP